MNSQIEGTVETPHRIFPPGKPHELLAHVYPKFRTIKSRV